MKNERLAAIASQRNMIDTIGAVWEANGVGVPFAKFLLDAFSGAGIMGFYELPDSVVITQLAEYYKNPPKPIKGRTLYLKNGKVTEINT